MRVLVFISYFLPGFKSGGPVKTLKNMVDNLKNIDFFIVTLNHDIDGSFYDVKNNIWIKAHSANILYIDKKDVGKSFFRNVIDEINPDYIYINSFFDRNFSMKFMIYNFSGKLFDHSKVVLAPRGEFSSGALAIKPMKKRIYIKAANYIGLYKKVFFQASNSLEKEDIENIINCRYIKIASDMPDLVEFKEVSKESSILKVIHISRITKMKNLIFCLNILQKCKVDIEFDIYGPIEDNDYWEECCQQISKMPSNIKVNYFGQVAPEEIRLIVSKYNLLFLPSLGENFCHVIAESFSCGVPVLISDRTPWKGLSQANLGWDIPLENFDEFIDILNNYSENYIIKLSSAEIYKNYLSYFNLNNIIECNYNIFSEQDS